MPSLTSTAAPVGLELAALREHLDVPGVPFSVRATGDRMPPAQDLAARCVPISGRAVSESPLCLALGYVSTVIAEGTRARYRQGRSVGGGLELVGTAVEELADAPLAALDGDLS
ncbi:MAG: aminoglycoside phosphotransferase [Frankiales bacterium]|nr:aminoglycoside phosphotransferase [Frankiales bacterium]